MNMATSSAVYLIFPDIAGLRVTSDDPPVTHHVNYRKGCLRKIEVCARQDILIRMNTAHHSYSVRAQKGQSFFITYMSEEEVFVSSAQLLLDKATGEIPKDHLEMIVTGTGSHEEKLLLHLTT